MGSLLLFLLGRFLFQVKLAQAAQGLIDERLFFFREFFYFPVNLFIASLTDNCFQSARAFLLEFDGEFHLSGLERLG